MSLAALAMPFALALLPIIWLIVALVAFHLPAWKAALGSFGISCVLALTWWGMPVMEVATEQALRAFSWPCGPSCS